MVRSVLKTLFDAQLASSIRTFKRMRFFTTGGNAKKLLPNPFICTSFCLMVICPGKDTILNVYGNTGFLFCRLREFPNNSFQPLFNLGQIDNTENWFSQRGKVRRTAGKEGIEHIFHFILEKNPSVGN